MSLCRDCGVLTDPVTAVDGLHPGCDDLGVEKRWWQARLASPDLGARRAAERLMRAAAAMRGGKA